MHQTVDFGHLQQEFYEHMCVCRHDNYMDVVG